MEKQYPLMFIAVGSFNLNKAIEMIYDQAIRKRYNFATFFASHVK